LLNTQNALNLQLGTVQFSASDVMTRLDQRDGLNQPFPSLIKIRIAENKKKKG
jgi:hypothetical protein